MDLSKLSDADLDALEKGQLANLSDEGLNHLLSQKSETLKSTKWDQEKEAAKQIEDSEKEKVWGKSSYDGVPDKDLAWYQKAEKWLVDHDVVKPGYEMFSPNAIKTTGMYAALAPAEMVTAAAQKAPEAGSALLEMIKHVPHLAHSAERIGKNVMSGYGLYELAKRATE